MIVFYRLNRLNRLKNQVLCGVPVVADRLNAAAVAVKSVKNGAVVGFLHLTKKIAGLFACSWDALPGLLWIGAGSMVDALLDRWSIHCRLGLDPSNTTY